LICFCLTMKLLPAQQQPRVVPHVARGRLGVHRAPFFDRHPIWVIWTSPDIVSRGTWRGAEDKKGDSHINVGCRLNSKAAFANHHQ
jgi:hypothetical protein